jgi:alcohol dehydrogenase (NADP+)
MLSTMAYAARNALSNLKPHFIDRREVGAFDIKIDVLFCGVCHSDVHQKKNEWKNTIYPCVPGHEIIGKVTAVGQSVTRFKVGDRVGVGCMVDSCRHCEACQEGLEQYCDNGFTATYNGNMRSPSKDNLTFGGYAQMIVVNEDFVLTIPQSLDSAAAAPLLCAGVTTYSPLKHWGIGPSDRVGVAGLGGLGHMAVKIAKAMGAEVTVITSSPDKMNDAIALGASRVIFSNDEDSLKAHEKSLDFILSTIPQPHDINPFMRLLARDGTLTVVGCIAPLSAPLDLSKMVPDRKSLSTSLIGSVKETQEVLEFCAEHNITANIKIIDIETINEAFNDLDKGNLDYRYVIDMNTLKDKQVSDSLLDKVADALSS